jgi:hypothetical protein
VARKGHDDTIKAAVMSALLAGQSVADVAKKYKLPQSTVSTWKSQAGAVFDSIGIEKKERIGDLILDNLEASLLATKAMADAFADTKWIKRQNASEIAVLYGVIQDKTFRVLEALPDDSGSVA